MTIPKQPTLRWHNGRLEYQAYIPRTPENKGRPTHEWHPVFVDGAEVVSPQTWISKCKSCGAESINLLGVKDLRELVDFSPTSQSPEPPIVTC